MDRLDHRPRVAEMRRDRMRARLFVSALTLVASKGPDAVSIDDVVSEAGVSRGTFYKYFPSSTELISAAAVELTNELIAMAEVAVQHFDDPVQRLACGFRLVVGLPQRLPLVANFLVRLGWPSTDRSKLLLDFVRRDLSDGMRAGRFAAMPIELALNIVAGIAIGAAHVLLHQHDEALVGAATISVLNALGVSPDEAKRISTLRLPAPIPTGTLLLSALALPTADRKELDRHNARFLPRGTQGGRA